MGIRTSIEVHGYYEDILHCLEANVGKLLHSAPMLFWHGKGWHMSSVRTPRRGKIFKRCYTIEFTDEKKAIWFRLLWE
jgi:hypothetical protein